MASHSDNQQRRVVITGVGVIAANGSDKDTFWRSVRDGQSAADYMTRFDVSAIPSKVSAEVKYFDAGDYMDRKAARRLDRALQFSVAAARAAKDDAKIDFSMIDADRCGVAEGTSMSNNSAAHETTEAFRRRGYKGVSISGVISGAAGAGSGEVAYELGVKGHAVTICSSSASGNDAIGYALNMIRGEDVDVMIAGGAEAPLIESAWGGLCANRVMTRHNDDPKRAMRPFDKSPRWIRARRRRSLCGARGAQPRAKPRSAAFMRNSPPTAGAARPITRWHRIRRVSAITARSKRRCDKAGIRAGGSRLHQRARHGDDRQRCR